MDNVAQMIEVTPPTRPRTKSRDWIDHCYVYSLFDPYYEITQL